MLYVIIFVLSVAVFLLTIHLIFAKEEVKELQHAKEFWYRKWFEESDENIRLGSANQHLLEDITKHFADYRALEQGRDEESEAYEMQFLTFSETLESQSHAIEKLNEALDDHDKFCLPLIVEASYVPALDPGEPMPIFRELMAERIG